MFPVCVCMCVCVCVCVLFASEYEDGDGPKQWTNLRYAHVMKLRQAALDSARDMWADYFLVRECVCARECVCTRVCVHAGVCVRECVRWYRRNGTFSTLLYQMVVWCSPASGWGRAQQQQGGVLLGLLGDNGPILVNTGPRFWATRRPTPMHVLTHFSRPPLFKESSSGDSGTRSSTPNSNTCIVFQSFSNVEPAVPPLFVLAPQTE